MKVSKGWRKEKGDAKGYLNGNNRNGGVMVVDKWLSIREIQEQLDMPEQTVRRYVRDFEMFILTKKTGRKMMLAPGTAGTIKRISNLYKQRLGTQEIKRILESELPQIVEIENEPEKAATYHDLIKKFAEQQAKQQDLLERIERQQHIIEESLQRRDEQLMKTLRELAAARNKKNRWKFWR